MLPMSAVRLRLATLLATDTTNLNQAANANKVQLIVAPFSLNENLTIAGLTLASAAWMAALNCALGAAVVGVDPVTGQQLITIPVIAGGWRWVSSGGAGYPVTVYGWALTDKTTANLWGVGLLPTPIAVTADGQQIDLGELTIRFVLQPMS